MQRGSCCCGGQRFINSTENKLKGWTIYGEAYMVRKKVRGVIYANASGDQNLKVK